MGCNCSRDEAKVVVNRQLKEKNTFIIKIHIPESDKIKIVVHESKVDFMLLSELINNTLYCGKYAEELDANFISVYNKYKEEFDYYIQRLAGYELEKEEDPLNGRLWVPYINNAKMDWSQLCSQNRVVKKDDNIELRYERYITDHDN